jgi:hypothetical protein
MYAEFSTHSSASGAANLDLGAEPANRDPGILKLMAGADEEPGYIASPINRSISSR